VDGSKGFFDICEEIYEFNEFYNVKGVYQGDEGFLRHLRGDLRVQRVLQRVQGGLPGRRGDLAKKFYEFNEIHNRCSARSTRFGFLGF
jgi:hypothetical protein